MNHAIIVKLVRCLDALRTENVYSMIRTKELLSMYDISRQTLYNWIKEGKLSEPIKDWRGWRVWTEEHKKAIEEIITNKTEQLSFLEEENPTFHINNRRYLGSKYKLLEFIKKVVEDNCQSIESVADIFGGTGVVADCFNDRETKIIVNDILYSNYISYFTWFSDEEVDWEKVHTIINQFNEVDIDSLDENYVSINFGDSYFTKENAKRIGFIREEIEQLSGSLTFREKAILITSLLYAMDKVANTVGHYDAYRRKLDSVKPLRLLVPGVNDENNKNNEIFRMDANLLVRDIKADLVYIDTPYNSRQYGDAYHLLENIAEWKKPEVTGVAKKMINRQHIKSDYCTMKAPQAFADLVKHIDSKYILVSYNNMAEKGVGRSNAKISDEDIIETLKIRGTVQTFEMDYQAYTTGKTNIEDHKEILYLCTVEEGS